MNIDYDEPVFRKEVESEAEYVEQGWKVFFNIYYRLCNQRAPPTLIQEIVDINNLYKQLHEKIGKVKNYFPG
jgi:hypothetical protein